jgi:sec-independent protein translocase protein TatB
MFNIGGMELVAIGAVGLVVLGPDRLPVALRQLGALLGHARRISHSVQVDLAAVMAPDGAEPTSASDRASS